MSSQRPYAVHTLICTVCSARTVVPRAPHRLREQGHVKDFWCIRCKTRTPHREVRP